MIKNIFTFLGVMSVLFILFFTVLVNVYGLKLDVSMKVDETSCTVLECTTLIQNKVIPK